MFRALGKVEKSDSESLVLVLYYHLPLLYSLDALFPIRFHGARKSHNLQPRSAPVFVPHPAHLVLVASMATAGRFHLLGRLRPWQAGQPVMLRRMVPNPARTPPAGRGDDAELIDRTRLFLGFAGKRPNGEWSRRRMSLLDTAPRCCCSRWEATAPWTNQA